MRPRLLSIPLVLLLVACGGDGGTDGTDGAPDGPATTAPGGEVDPQAVVLFVANGSTLTRIEPGSETETVLVSDLVNAFQAWALDGSVWVSDSEGRLIRVDPDSGEVLLDVETGMYVEELAVGDGSIWVLNGQLGLETAINQLDPSSGAVVATVVPEAGSYFSDIAFGEGALWAIGGDPTLVSVISRIDPATATVTDMIDTGMGPDSISTGYGSVWAVGGAYMNPDGSGNAGMDLVRIDPSTNEVASRLDVSESDGFPDLATGYDSVWLTDTAAGELVRVSSDGTVIEARIAIGSGGADLYEIDLAKGLVWAANPFEGRVYAVDPSSNELQDGITGSITRFVAFAP